jgi:ankyrin repeat protein
MAACLLIELGHCRWEEDWEETLTFLPADLFGIYSRFFTRAKDTPRLSTVFIQAIFRWLVFSARPVTSNELADAIAFRLDDPAFDFSDLDKSIYYPKRRQGNSDIFTLLEGLIVIKNDRWSSAKLTIAFAHSSVKDYVLSPQFQQAFGPFIDLTRSVSHKFITQTCVRYLLIFADAKHSVTEKTLPEYPLSLYAAKYWHHHLSLCNERDQEALLPSTMHLLEDGSSQYGAWSQLWTLDWTLVQEHISSLCMCSHIGFTKGVHSLLIDHNTSVNLVTEDGRTALHLASDKGHLDIAQLLIEHNACVDLANRYGTSALHLTSDKGHLNIARLLIEHSASVDLATKDGETALHIALDNGHLDIAQLLIEHKASVDLANKYGETGLHLTSDKGHLSVAQLLIEHNASVDLANRYGTSALHLTSDKGHLNIASHRIWRDCTASRIKEGLPQHCTAVH